MRLIRHEIKYIYRKAGTEPSYGVPVYSHQSPGEQVGQLKRCRQIHHHSTSLGTRSRQEETQSIHQFPDQTLISSDDDQRPAAQEAKHGMLGKRVLFEEPEGSESSPPPLLPV